MVLLVPVSASQLFDYGGVASESLVIIGGMVLVLLPLLIGLTVWKLPERDTAPPRHQPVIRNLKIMLSNGSFLILFFGFTLMSLGTTMIGTLFMLFTTFAMDLERQAQPILLAYFAVNIIGLPFWVWLSHKIGKREAWLTGTLAVAIATPSYLLLSPGQLVPFRLITGVIGFFGGNFVALSLSMKADVIEIASRQSRDSIAGAYMAIWSLGSKTTQALAGASSASCKTRPPQHQASTGSPTLIPSAFTGASMYPLPAVISAQNSNMAPSGSKK